MRNSTLPTILHSWPLKKWPATVFPNDPKRAKYLVREYRDSLVKAGALVRIGRDLVILGAPFASWLQQQAPRVDGFKIAANRERSPEAASAS